MILGSMMVNGNLIKTANLYEKLEYIAEQGAKTVYVSLTNQPDAITMLGEIWSKLSILFYGRPDELMRKIFGLEWEELYAGGINYYRRNSEKFEEF